MVCSPGATDQSVEVEVVALVAEAVDTLEEDLFDLLDDGLEG